MSLKLHWKDFAASGEAFHIQNDLRVRQWGVDYHTHDFAELFWVYTGRARHRVNGHAQELGAGHLVFIRSNDSHRLETMPPDPLGLVNIAFPLSTLRDLRQRYFTGMRRWFWGRDTLPETVQLETARLTRLQEWAETLVHAPRTRFEIERFLMNLFHLLSAGVEEEPLPPEAPDWLAAACAQIRKQKNRQEGVPAFVRCAARSPEHVARMTQKWLELSPTNYVNQIRLSFMERQLRLTAHDILDVTMEAGFSNLGHAYKLFKQRYGLPPRQYRQKHRQVIV